MQYKIFNFTLTFHIKDVNKRHAVQKHVLLIDSENLMMK